MRAYFESYAAHFKLAPYIRLRSRVERATLRDDGRWSIRLSGIGRGGAVRSPHRMQRPPSCSAYARLSRPLYWREPAFAATTSVPNASEASACWWSAAAIRDAILSSMWHALPGGPVSACAGRAISCRKSSSAAPFDAQYQRAQAVPRVFRQSGAARIAPRRNRPDGTIRLTRTVMRTARNASHAQFRDSSRPDRRDVLPRVGIQYLDGNNVHFRDGKDRSIRQHHLGDGLRDVTAVSRRIGRRLGCVACHRRYI